MKKPRLYLVGTVHFDLDGKERLDTILNKVAPSVIALELNKKDLEDIERAESSRKSPEEERKEMSALIDKSGLKLSSKQRATLIKSENRLREAVGYELKSSREYVLRSKKSRLEYIDISLFENDKEGFVNGYGEAANVMLKQFAENPELAREFVESLDGGIDAYLQQIRENLQLVYQNAEAMVELFEMIRSPEGFEMMKETMPPQAVQAMQKIYNPARDEAMANRVRELYDGKKRLVAVVGLGHLCGLETKVEDLEPEVMTLADYNSV